MNTRMDQRMAGQMVRFVGKWIDTIVVGLMNGKIAGRMDGEVDAWIDCWMEVELQQDVQMAGGPLFLFFLSSGRSFLPSQKQTSQIDKHRRTKKNHENRYNCKIAHTHHTNVSQIAQLTPSPFPQVG